jgi:integrase
MRIIGKLTGLAVQRATKRGMHGDGAGLYLQVAEGGSKSWILRFKKGGRTRHFGIGPLHTVTLAEARLRAAEARLMLLDNRDPIEARRASRAAQAKAMTFDEATAQFIEAHAAGWGAQHREQWRQTIAAYASPIIGAVDVRTIETADIMLVLTPIWSAKPDTASRLRGRMENILDWSKVRGLRDRENPARWRGHLDCLLPGKRKVRAVEHHAALPYAEAAAFMASLRQRSGVKARALEFAILTAARTGEAIGARWPEIDLERKLWVVPSTRMKSGREHRSPLADRALEILSEMAAIRSSEFVFPGQSSGRPIGELALFTCLRDMGRSDVTVHGFRSSFRDWAGNETSFPRELAEHALAHVVGDLTRRGRDRDASVVSARPRPDRGTLPGRPWSDYLGQ